MDKLKALIKPALPEGAIIGDIYRNRAKRSEMIIEYLLDGKMHFVSPERISAGKASNYRTVVVLHPSLTYNDLYEQYSKKHNLNFIKGIDYDDNPEPVTKQIRYYLPINPLSLRYLPGSIVVDTTWPGDGLFGDEDERRLTDIDIDFTPKGFEAQLFQLRFHFHDGSAIQCFDEGRLTIAFRQLIADNISNEQADIKKEVLASVILNAYSDLLSDVLILIGPSEIPYLIRYQSAEGDIP